jgi:Zn-dependent protease with chaperone function
MSAARGSRVRLPDLAPDAFICPGDRAALDRLRRLPVLPMLLGKFNEFAVDRILYAQNSAETVRCGPRQLSSVYRILQEACEILDVPEPELYLRYSPSYNAYTAGVKRTFIVLHSALVDDFTDEELLFVVGHELGHVKCGHVLYQMLARLLLHLLQELGSATFGIGRLAGLGVLSAFMEWLRQAELTCDRAGLLVCQDPRVALSATMKLGCGATRFSGEMDVDAFLEQARAHSEGGGLEGAAKVLLFFLYTWQLDHPQVVFRAKELDAWVAGGEYERILAGDHGVSAAPVEEEEPV